MEIPICSVSGGKDSTVLYCLMVETYGQNFVPIFADTGNEHPVTVNYVRNLHTMAGGPPAHIVKADFSEKISKQVSSKNKTISGNPFMDMMMEQLLFIQNRIMKIEHTSGIKLKLKHTDSETFKSAMKKIAEHTSSVGFNRWASLDETEVALLKKLSEKLNS